MAVPPFTAFWMPVLRNLTDGRVWTANELAEVLAEEFALTADDRMDRIPSGKTRLLDRTQWTITYLRQAGVVSSPKRGTVVITERGRDILRQNPPTLDREYLLQFLEFREFVSRRKVKSPLAIQSDPDEHEGSAPDESQPPQEIMDQAHQTIVAVLADEILSALKRLPPARFEQVVVDVLVAMGYGGTREDASNVVGKSGDGGIDGVIKEDRLGLDTIYVQAKRWEGTVGRSDVASFVGSLLSFQSGKRVFITTGTYSAEARRYIEQMRSDKRVVLIDGPMLARLMVEHNVGVAVVSRYEIKSLVSDYFVEV